MQCTTHWYASDLFKTMYPDIDLVHAKIITENKGIYTSGGALSSFNMILRLIEKFYGREIAINCSKGLEIDLDKKSQLPYMIFSGQKNHDDEDIKLIQKYIEENIVSKITVNDISNTFSINKRNLERRFKKATGNSPMEYLQRVKVEYAKKSFESERKTVLEVMYALGYNDLKGFRNIFKKHSGMSPKDYKDKFRK